MEQYQDIYVKGEITEGVRDCAPRYEAIREFLSQYERPFTVFDLGANLGYFSLRIVEDFPEATVVAFESHYGDWLKEVLEQNGNPERLIFLRHHLSLASLMQLGEVAFPDVTLALSVVHHLGAPYFASLRALRKLGTHLIMELPSEPNACGQEIVQQAVVPGDAEMLLESESHLGGTRPMFVVSDNKSGLKKAYVGSPKPPPPFSVRADFQRKTLAYKDRNEMREWIRGINLQTYLSYGGELPTLERVVEMIVDNPPREHSDLRPWNVILSGDGCHFIDTDDPRQGDNHRVDFGTFLDSMRLP